MLLDSNQVFTSITLIKLFFLTYIQFWLLEETKN